MSGISSKALFAYVFFCFFPYPAFGLSNNAGLQLAHVLNILYLPLMLSCLVRHKNILYIYIILIVPSFASVFVGDNYIVNINAAIAQAYALLSFLVVGILVSMCGIRPVIYASIYAIVIHLFVGLWQQVSYQSEEFPIIWLYSNPSFAVMEAEATRMLYGVYTKRSFGIFPEPSSMFASLAPFLVLLIYTRILFKDLYRKIGFVFIGGCLLLYLSKSGGILYFMMAMIPYVWVLRSYLFVGNGAVKIVSFVILGLLLSVLFLFLFDSFQDRVISEAIQDEGSWSQRFQSIKFGLEAPFNGEVLNFVFGYGLGDVSELAERATGRPSIHSWVAGNIMGSGLIGFLSLFFVILLILFDIGRSGQKHIGYICFFIWISCVSVVTGYFQLLSVWSFLGILAAWRRIF